jgi:formylglycine-generating enzyme required for sulfatase activity
MSGNVWEWCSDWYGADYYKNSPTVNLQGPTSGSSRVLRGGSWYNDPQYCRVAYRLSYTPDNRDYFVGFRLARTK